MKLEDQLFELGRVLDDAARNLFNLTVGSSATLSHTSALFVIFIVSGLIFAVFSLAVMAATSIFAGCLTIWFLVLPFLLLFWDSYEYDWLTLLSNLHPTFVHSYFGLVHSYLDCYFLRGKQRKSWECTYVAFLLFKRMLMGKLAVTDYQC